MTLKQHLTSSVDASTPSHNSSYLSMHTCSDKASFFGSILPSLITSPITSNMIYQRFFHIFSHGVKILEYHRFLKVFWQRENAISTHAQCRVVSSISHKN